MVIYFTTNRGGMFIVTKSNIDNKTIKKQFKGRKITHHEICKSKTIDTIFNHWEHNERKMGITPSDKCWVINLDDVHNDYMTREEIKEFIS